MTRLFEVSSAKIESIDVDDEFLKHQKTKEYKEDLNREKESYENLKELKSKVEKLSPDKKDEKSDAEKKSLLERIEDKLKQIEQEKERKKQKKTGGSLYEYYTYKRGSQEK